ncbi:hypothetical protein JCM3770_007228 [Rhodotorula araucariae]
MAYMSEPTAWRYLRRNDHKGVWSLGCSAQLGKGNHWGGRSPAAGLVEAEQDVLQVGALQEEDASIGAVQDVPVDAHAYWCTLRNAFRPTDVQGLLRLLTRFWGLSRPAASPKAFAALHLFAALPFSLAALQTTIAVANQSTLPKPGTILDIVRDEVLRTAPAGGSIALAAVAVPGLQGQPLAPRRRGPRPRRRPAPAGDLATLLDDVGVEGWLARLLLLSPAPRSPVLDSGASDLMCGNAVLFAYLRRGRVVKLNGALLVPGISTTLNRRVAGASALLAALSLQAELTTWHHARIELVHSEVLSVNVPSLSGRRYVVTFTEDFSRMLWVEPLARKSDVLAAFMRFKAAAKNESAHRLQRLRPDSGVEGIISLLNQAGAPKDLWAEALQAFIFVKNRSPHAALLGKVPFATWRGWPVCVDMLRVCGCRAWHTVTHGRSKLDVEAAPLVFIGYDVDTAAYQLLDPASRKIQAVTPAFDLVISPGVVAADAPVPHTLAPPAAVCAVPPAPACAQSELLFRTPPPACPHSKRAAPPPSPDSPDPIHFLDDPFGATLAHVEAMLAGTGDSLAAAEDDFALPSSDLRNDREAARDVNCDRWREGEQDEFSSLRDEYHVFHAVDRSEVPADANVLGC